MGRRVWWRCCLCGDENRHDCRCLVGGFSEGLAPSLCMGGLLILFVRGPARAGTEKGIYGIYSSF